MAEYLGRFYKVENDKEVVTSDEAYTNGYGSSKLTVLAQKAMRTVDIQKQVVGL